MNSHERKGLSGLIRPTHVVCTFTEHNSSGTPLLISFMIRALTNPASIYLARAYQARCWILGIPHESGGNCGSGPAATLGTVHLQVQSLLGHALG